MKSTEPLFIPLSATEEAQFRDMATEIVDNVKAGHHEAAYARLPAFMDLCPDRWEHENKKVHVLSGMAYDALPRTIQSGLRSTSALLMMDWNAPVFYPQWSTSADPSALSSATSLGEVPLKLARASLG